MSNTVIQIENLSKKYKLGAIGATDLREQITNVVSRMFRRSNTNLAASNEVLWALKDINLEVQQGEILGIIGHNGAGKSTLFKILSRIVHPTTGRIEIKGRVASLLEVGTGFHPELTGRENIFMNAAILGMKRNEIHSKFDEIVSFAGVEKFIDTPVKRYSSGMYMRLAFAVAAHLDPEILIVDEVLSVGDVAFQKKSLGKMQDVHRQGRTVLFVSHNLGAVSSLCTKAIHLEQGRIKMIGETSEVISDYINTARSAMGERIWDAADAPASDKVRLRSVRVICDGEVTSDVDIAREVHVEIEYEVLENGADVTTGIHLISKLGVEVLASANFASATKGNDEWAGQQFPCGIYRSICAIPENFLNDTSYSITVIFVTGVTHTEFREDNAISFTVYDSGEMRKEFTGSWLGVVRPKLVWRTHKLTMSHF